jgi:cell pole-organizing protein PopZ
MAEPAKDTDQSMEDILQSIKRIIADEGEPPPAAGSDVLELTDLLAEDAAPPVVDDTKEAVPTVSLDEIIAEPEPAPEVTVAPQAAPEPVVASAPEPMPAPAPEPKPEPVVAKPVASEGLMAEATLNASVAALNALSHVPAPAVSSLPSPAFRSGATVEDLVLEALKPMLKEWLDGNLPTLVSTLVEKEIRRLSGH